MNTGVDMPSVFEARVTELGMKELLPKFTAKGWGTYGNFANAMVKAPGEFDGEAFEVGFLPCAIGYSLTVRIQLQARGQHVSAP